MHRLVPILPILLTLWHRLNPYLSTNDLFSFNRTGHDLLISLPVELPRPVRINWALRAPRLHRASAAGCQLLSWFWPWPRPRPVPTKSACSGNDMVETLEREQPELMAQIRAEAAKTAERRQPVLACRQGRQRPILALRHHACPPIRGFSKCPPRPVMPTTRPKPLSLKPRKSPTLNRPWPASWAIPASPCCLATRPSRIISTRTNSPSLEEVLDERGLAADVRQTHEAVVGVQHPFRSRLRSVPPQCRLPSSSI